MKKLISLFSVLLALLALTGCSTTDQLHGTKIKLSSKNLMQVIIDYDRDTGSVVRVDARYFPSARSWIDDVKLSSPQPQNNNQ